MRTQPPRHWASLQYRSAKDFLVNVAPLRIALANSMTSEEVRNLRTNDLRGERELWQASLFAHGIGSAVLHSDIYLAPVEDDDFDCVAQCLIDDTQFYTPIQIKELVPEHKNPRASLNAEIAKLEKYADSADLVVAFYLNRHFRFDLDSIVIPLVSG